MEERRTKLSIKFKLRHTEVFEVNKTATNIYQVSAVPYLQKLLNKHYREEEAQNKS